MPGPTTEVLNDDLKEIRADRHKVEMAVTAEIHKVDNSVAKLGAEFAVFKWLLGATLATTLAGIAGSASWAGSLASRVGAVEGQLDKLDGRLERIEALLLKGRRPTRSGSSRRPRPVRNQGPMRPEPGGLRGSNGRRIMTVVEG